MRLRELTGYKNIELYKKAKEILGGDIRDKPLYATLDEWQEIMKSYGFTHLGTGSYGSAYEHPSYPWVFKVFKHDDPYLSFFKYARRNQNNPNLPRIKGSYIRIGNDAYAVRLEKLRPITREEWSKVEHIIDVFEEMLFVDDQDDQYYDQEQNNSKEQQELMTNFPGIYKLLAAIRYSDAFPNNAFPDHHSGNVMMRGDVPVFIDPVVE